MSLLPRSLRQTTVSAVTASACASSSAPRLFSTSSTSRAATGRDRNIGDWDMARMDEFQFDDATSLGHLRLQKIEEARALISKVELDRASLRAQARKFREPTGQIRITSTLDLSDPKSAYHNKRVLVAPVSALPLANAEAIHRLKLLAGPRWTPGPPGRGERGALAMDSGADIEAKDVGKDGWVKIAEDRFPEPKMNRKSVSDMLERLVEAANDKESPLPATTPLDPRHLLARQRKKRQRSAEHVWARAEALRRRPEVIGGVRGFPKEWLGGEAVTHQRK